MTSKTFEYCVSWFILVLHLFATETYGKNTYDEELEKFVRSKMEGYGEWLNGNSSVLAPITLTSNARISNFTFAASNLMLTSPKRTYIPYPSSTGKLSQGNLTVEYYSYGESTKISGHYILDGTLFSSVPVSGLGTFKLDIGDAFDNETGAYIYKLTTLFDVTGQEFLKLDAPTATSLYFLASQTQLTLENISAGGYEALVEEIIDEEFLSLFQSYSSENLFQTMLMQYLTQVFDATSFFEIIGS